MLIDTGDIHCMLMMNPMYGHDAFHSKGCIKPSDPSFCINEHEGLLIVFTDIDMLCFYRCRFYDYFYC